MRYLCGTNDKDLEELFFKETDPKKEDLVKIGKQYEVGQNSRAVKKEKEKVAAIFKGQGKEPKICLLCDIKGHLAQECRKLKAERIKDDSNMGNKKSWHKNKSREGSSKEKVKASCTAVRQISGQQSTPRLKLSMRGTKGSQFTFNALPDTGTARTIISGHVIWSRPMGCLLIRHVESLADTSSTKWARRSNSLLFIDRR